MFEVAQNEEQEADLLSYGYSKDIGHWKASDKNLNIEDFPEEPSHDMVHAEMESLPMPTIYPAKCPICGKVLKVKLAYFSHIVTGKQIGRAHV